MAPKRQSTDAKRARAAARDGQKYTTALREGDGFRLPPHVDPLDTDALPEDERLVVDELRALAADGRAIPVREVDPDPDVTAALERAAADGRTPLWPRWASVRATADGYVLREVKYGPNRSGYTKEARGPRVPVPVRAADGTVTVAALPEWARLDTSLRWVWAHTGWPVDAPGRIVNPPQKFMPAPGLRWEVAVYLDLGLDGRRGVLGEDYGGSNGGWETVGWCTSRDDARQIARAYVAHRGHYARADVVDHGTDNGVVPATSDTYLPAPDAPDRPRPATPAGPRPASPDRADIPEPAWYPGETHPPNVSLIVWTGTAWRTLAWSGHQTSMIAQNLGIGAGGPYEWAEGWGPRHPDRNVHDWTQEGRSLWGRYPEPTHQESARQHEAARQAREDALVAALADRGGFTRDQAAARLTQGGEDYREVLDVGQATISRALHTARRALPEGPERTAVRYALDDLTDRHLLPDDAERIAADQLDTEIEAKRAPDVTAWCRRAVAEYVTPTPAATA